MLLRMIIKNYWFKYKIKIYLNQSRFKKNEIVEERLFFILMVCQKPIRNPMVGIIGNINGSRSMWGLTHFPFLKSYVKCGDR